MRMDDEPAEEPMDLIRPVHPRIQRRRASLYVPPDLGKNFATFTEGELAVLKIISGEVVRHGVCTLTRDAIADLSSTSRGVVTNAVRVAETQGLIKAEQGSRFNTITVSAKWK
jgi:hypothetical protein